MSDAVINSCKWVLNNLISSEVISESSDPLQDFSSAILNFYNHYCLDDHTSNSCHHEKEIIYIE